MEPERRYPSFARLYARARRRLPRFAFDYLAGGAGREARLAANASDLDRVRFRQHLMGDEFSPDLGREIFARRFALPVGVAPVGLSGLIWPRSAEYLAAAAARANVPFVLSTVATTSLERIVELSDGNAWFQLYTPNSETINDDLLARAERCGYEVLVLTVDVPRLARRERDIANGLSIPPALRVQTIVQAALSPAWSLATLRGGIPRFANLAPYVPTGKSVRDASGYVDELSRGRVSLERARHIRDKWKGRLIIKGVLDEVDVAMAGKIGADGVWVSNHGGRQLDAAVSIVDALPRVRKAAGRDMAVFADSGVMSGLDVARLSALGADFVFAGRAFYAAVAALGERGAAHAMAVMGDELTDALTQIGCRDMASLASFVVRT